MAATRGAQGPSRRPFLLGVGGCVCVCEGHGLPATRVGVVAGVLGGKSGT